MKNAHKASTQRLCLAKFRKRMRESENLFFKRLSILIELNFALWCVQKNSSPFSLRCFKEYSSRVSGY